MRSSKEARENLREPIRWFFQTQAGLIADETGIPPEQYKFYRRVRENLLSLSEDKALDQAAIAGDPEEVADKIELYGITTITDSAKEFGECLAKAGIELAKALALLEDFKGLEPVLKNVHRLENDGDQITRVALQKLFTSDHQAPADLIKWKDLYALLESTMDECESVAEIMETISIKNV